MNYRNAVLFLPTINYWNRIIPIMRFFMHNDFNIKRSIILDLNSIVKGNPGIVPLKYFVESHSFYSRFPIEHHSFHQSCTLLHFGY